MSGCGGSRKDRFTTLDAHEYADTLLGDSCLVDCIDEIRDIATQLGARPYRVRWVRTQWTGKARGDGVENILCVEDVLPTPKVQDFDRILMMLQSNGRSEVGTLAVSEVSVSYTEDQLLGRGPGGAPIPRNEAFYWELALFMPDGTEIMRRFAVRGVPERQATSMQWRVQLIRASEDRNRTNGDPRG